MISIVDYGLGNIQAFANIYRNLGVDFMVAREADDLSHSSRLILPGVGAFDWAMQRLNSSGMRPILDDLVLNQHVPVLGICVGMQMMANSSEEGRLPGLGWIPGQVKRFDQSLHHNLSLPHMGWNDIKPKSHPLFSNMDDQHFYFLHSYYFLPSSEAFVLAETQYCELFAAAVCKQHIIGVQFHPEKSHHWGIQLLQNFAEHQF